MNDPMLEVSGVVEAPLEDVAEMVLSVGPGRVGSDNAWLLGGGPYAAATLTGGPDRFIATADGHSVTVEIDRGSRTFALQGGWWYRGEYTLEPGSHGTRLTHRVYNVATRLRFGVPLANRFFVGFEESVRRGFEELLVRTGERLGCTARLER
ncbi:MAG: hypothetical protein ACRDN9_04095 [Streptosporangiaceae bacterium]